MHVSVANYLRIRHYLQAIICGWLVIFSNVLDVIWVCLYDYLAILVNEMVEP